MADKDLRKVLRKNPKILGEGDFKDFADRGERSDVSIPRNINIKTGQKIGWGDLISDYTTRKR